MMAPSSGPHLALFAMWAAMMIGMMLPSAAPTLLIYGMVARRGDGAGDAPLRVHIFAGGYLVVWTVFSAVAALAQHAFTATDLLTPMMEARAPLATGANLGVIIGPRRTVFLLLEKLMPPTLQGGRFSGVVLLVAGLYMTLAGLRP
jgi:predicted metal-binding membrane protein